LAGWGWWHPRGAGSSPGGREFPMPRGKNPPRWVGQGSGGFSVGVKSRGSRFLLMKCGRGPFQPPHPSFFLFVHNLYSFCVRVFANEMHWYSELFNCKFLLFSILSNWLPVLSCLQRRLCHQPTCSSDLEAPKVTVSKFWCVVICCF